MSRRSTTLAVLAFVGSLLVVVPALGNTSEDAVRLHLGTDGRYFSYGATNQPLTTARNGCQITSPEPLIHLSALKGSTTVSAGLASLSIGVKSSGSNSNGTPCSQVDSTETLSLEAQNGAGSVLAGRSFNKVRLDVEMTGDAVVMVKFFTDTTLKATATLQTGTNIDPAQTQEGDYDILAPYEVTTDLAGDGAGLTDSCAAPNSSGPNNAGNDNCLWTIDPGQVFDRVELKTSHGTVSLEGSADFGNDPSHDSLFFIANTTPDATDDDVTTDEDTPGTFDVLANDTDADGDGLTITGVTGGANGSVVNNGSDVTYTPEQDFSGPDSFTYTVSDGAASDTATVNVTVNPVNDAPVGIVGNATTDEDTSATIEVATDVDSTDLTALCSTSNGGEWSDNGDGTVTYTPPPNFNGTDVLTCTVTDDEGATTTTEAEIIVTVGAVNDPPIANDDEAYTDDTAPVVVDVLANDTDSDANTDLEVASVDTTGTLGSVTIAADAETVTYTPPAGFTGSDAFGYTVTDGELTDTATVTVYELFECDETLTIAEGDVSAAYTRLPAEFGCDDGKPYQVDIITTDDGTTTPTEELPTVVFQPRSLTGQPVEDCSATPELCLDEFAAEIAFGPRDEANAPDTGTLHYDPVNREPADYNTSTTFRTMQWCEIVDFDPFAEPRPASDDILPSGESWCIASVRTGIASSNETLTTWTVYGIGDPAKRL